MRIGVLTGGKDCPGFNAVIRAVIPKGIEIYGREIAGFRDGWRPNVILRPERPFSLSAVCAEVLASAEVDAFGHRRLGTTTGVGLKGVGTWNCRCI